MKRTLHLLTATLLLIFTAQCVKAQSANGYFTHTVTKGQGLYSISRMYGVTENEIIALNPGSDVVIKVGQQLRIPQKEQINAQTNAEGQCFHTIKTGETLYRLTVIYGIKARDICDANPGLSAENFKVGQVIVIPQKEETEEESMVTTTTQIQQNEQTTQQTTTVSTTETNCRTEHLVKRKENIYRISRMYGITELELLNANPELKTRNLIKGETICIPYSSKDKVTVTVKDASPKTEAQDIQIPSNESLFAEVRTEIQDIDQIKAAIILPFILKEDSISSETQKMVEFYEGFLLALDSLKREGVSVDVHVYDSGNEWQSIAPILQQPEMRDMNIIIGPVYKKHIEEAANFADTTGIRLVLPFERKVDQVFNNPYIYQINTPQSYFYSEVYDHFFTQFQHPNVILFQSEGEKEDGMISGFKQELENRQVPYTVLIADTATNKDTIRAYMDLQRENILMMTSEKIGGLNNMMPVFQLLVRDTASTKYDIHLFGYPQYQVYTINHLASFYEIDTYFYSSFYTNNLLPQAVDFHKKYRRTYSKEIVNRFPKYAILGFDIGYYFLKALHLYGTDIDNRINEMQYAPIQTGFKFERVTTWGGFINRKVFFVHMSKDFELQKIDFD
ncbi:MAG: LysM peptidoglycan-binding domain-containing protein [Bacteroidaceae bacterium]|nr:LysM peptidoglycan-binding domain-containing protein [Bacteroidaceae bacterium]